MKGFPHECSKCGAATFCLSAESAEAWTKLHSGVCPALKAKAAEVDTAVVDYLRGQRGLEPLADLPPIWKARHETLERAYRNALDHLQASTAREADLHAQQEPGPPPAHDPYVCAADGCLAPLFDFCPGHLDGATEAPSAPKYAPGDRVRVAACAADGGFRYLVGCMATVRSVDGESVGIDVDGFEGRTSSPARFLEPAETCHDCPIGGREGDGPECPHVATCDRECEEFTASMAAEREAALSDAPETAADRATARRRSNAHQAGRLEEAGRIRAALEHEIACCRAGASWRNPQPEKTASRRRTEGALLRILSQLPKAPR